MHYIPLYGINFNGGDIESSTQEISEYFCADRCAQTTGCIGFTYSNGSECQAKNGDWVIEAANNQTVSALMKGMKSVAKLNCFVIFTCQEYYIAATVQGNENYNCGNL